MAFPKNFHQDSGNAPKHSLKMKKKRRLGNPGSGATTSAIDMWLAEAAS